MTVYHLKDESDAHVLFPLGRCFGLSPDEKNVKPFIVPEITHCDVCNEPTETAVCPSCHNTLPRSTFSGKNIVISIVGTRDSGKSVYIGVLIHELEHELAKAFNRTSEPFNEENTRTVYDKRYGMMYMGKVPGQTAEAATSDIDSDRNVFTPLVYSFNVDGTSTETPDDYSLIIYDVSGEDLTETNKLKRSAFPTFKADALIFILDGTKIGSMRQAFDKKELGGASNVDAVVEPSQILNRLDNSSRKRVRSIPTAIAISKIDMLKKLADSDSDYDVFIDELQNTFRISQHCNGKFDVAEAKEVSKEVSQLLVNYKGYETFRNKVGRHSNHLYFAFSALGFDNNPILTDENNPDSKVIGWPDPHRVEDPLLWILREKKVIPSTHQTVKEKIVDVMSCFWQRIVKHKTAIGIATLAIIGVIALCIVLTQPKIEPRNNEATALFPVMNKTVELIVPKRSTDNSFTLGDVIVHHERRHITVGFIGELRAGDRVGDGQTLSGRQKIFADIAISKDSLAGTRKVSVTLEKHIDGNWEFVSVNSRNINLRYNDGASVPYELFTHVFSRGRYRAHLYLDGYLLRADYQMRGQ
jgi:hypothetical protein